MIDLDSPSIYRSAYSVRARDCGSDGEMKDESLFEVLQEEAGAHADSRGWGFTDLLPQGRTWFLARMRLVVDRRPRYREPLGLHTWPRGVAGLIALRDFVILGADGLPAARATSSWLLMDFNARRPLRPTGIEASLTPHPARALEADAEKIQDFGGKPAAPPSGASSFRVRPSDLDVNDHVNNTVYIRMLEDALRETAGARKASSIEVNYLSEAFLGNELFLEVDDAPGQAGMTLARLTGADGTEHARYRLT